MNFLEAVFGKKPQADDSNWDGDVEPLPMGEELITVDGNDPDMQSQKRPPVIFKNGLS